MWQNQSISKLSYIRHLGMIGMGGNDNAAGVAKGRHRHYLPVSAFAALCAFALILGSIGPESVSAAESDAKSSAKALTDGENVLNTVRVDLPITGVSFKRSKVIDLKNDKSFEMAIDDKGNAIDAKKAIAAERLAYRKKHGNLHPLLVERMKGISDSEQIDVIMQLRTEPLPRISRQDNADVKNRLAKQRKIIGAAQARVGNVIKEIGGKVVAQPKMVPFLYARLQKSQVMHLSRLAAIGRLSISEKSKPMDFCPGTPTLPRIRSDIWRRAINRHDVVSQFDGSGVKVANAEIGLPASRASFRHTPIIMRSADSPEDHATMTSLAIAGDEPPEGVAPGAQLVVANAGTAEWGMFWASREHMAPVINSSEGRPPNGGRRRTEDVIVDWLGSHWPYPLIVRPAGNQGFTGCSSSDISVANMGWNGLTVGGSDPNQSDNRSHHTIWECSSWGNPQSRNNDRELPELVAPADEIYFPLDNNGCSTLNGGGGGTSTAAPIVAGAAALLIDVDPRLAGWPEALRALLIATANEDVDGDSISYDGFSGQPDHKDGVGELNVALATQIPFFRLRRTSDPGEVLSRGLDVGTIYEDDGQRRIRYRITNPFSNYRRVRIALAWTHLVDCRAQDIEGAQDLFDELEDCTGDDLSFDLDLRVYDYNDRCILTSLSWDNNYEVIQFNMDPNRTYTIEICPFDGDDFTWYGIAAADWPL